MRIDYTTVNNKIRLIEGKNRKNTRLIRVLNQGLFIHLIFQSHPKISYNSIAKKWFSGEISKMQVWRIYDEFLKIMK